MIGPTGTFAAPKLSDEFTEEDEAAFMADIAHMPVSSREHTVIMDMGMGLTITVGSPSDDETHLPPGLKDFGHLGAEAAVEIIKPTSKLLPEEPEAKCKCGDDKGDCVY